MKTPTTLISDTAGRTPTSNVAAIALMLAGLTTLGQLAIAAYLPAFAAMGEDLRASPEQIQQSLSAYMLPFALMIPWYGAVSDAVGRRWMILIGCFLFALGSLVCAFASGIWELHVGRGMQGASAGIGIIVGRALVRDLYAGMQAQKVMSIIMMIAAMSPALAPIGGGCLLVSTGWRSIFWVLALASILLLTACWLWLPETLPPARRHPLHPVPLARAYGAMLTHRRFVALSLANSAANVAIYVYVFSSPRFVTEFLGLGPMSFGWVFIPIVTGLVLGAFTAHRIAGRISPQRSVLLGHAVMSLAGIFNIAVCILQAPVMPWALVALPIFSAGMMLTQPSLQLMSLDCFPERRGLASSGYLAIQQLGVFLVSALLITLLDTPLKMAVSMAGLQALGLLWFLAAGRGKGDEATT